MIQTFSTMKKLFFFHVALLLIVSCSSEMDRVEPLNDFFSQTPHVLPKNLELNDSIYGRFMSANAFTPGQAPADQFQVFFSYRNLHVEQVSTLDHLRIYDGKKRLVKELDTQIWDGTDANGDYVFGEFSYVCTHTLPDGRTVRGIGYVLAIDGCVDPSYQLKYMHFPDQYHGRLGLVFPTSVDLSYCEE